MRTAGALDDAHPKSALGETTAELDVLEPVSVLLIKAFRGPQEKRSPAERLDWTRMHRKTHSAPPRDMDSIDQAVRLIEDGCDRPVRLRPLGTQRLERALFKYGVIVQDQRETAAS